MQSISKANNEHRDNSSRNNNVFDQPAAIFAAVVLGFAGTGVAMGLPLLVGSMAESLGFSNQQLGWLASSDMGGLFVGSVLTSFLVTRINRRFLAAAGLFLVILGNFISTQSPDLTADAEPVLCRNWCGSVLFNLHRKPCRKP